MQHDLKTFLRSYFLFNNTNLTSSIFALSQLSDSAHREVRNNLTILFFPGVTEIKIKCLNTDILRPPGYIGQNN
jgi:hypothetical protein